MRTTSRRSLKRAITRSVNITTNTAQFGMFVECDAATASTVCCTASAPCYENEGDCDYNADCRGNLKCGTDNCNQDGNGGNFASDFDCCVPGKIVSRFCGICYFTGFGLIVTGY